MPDAATSDGVQHAPVPGRLRDRILGFVFDVHHDVWRGQTHAPQACDKTGKGRGDGVPSSGRRNCMRRQAMPNTLCHDELVELDELLENMRERHSDPSAQDGARCCTWWHRLPSEPGEALLQRACVPR